jgi:hypothetical protein
MSALAGGARPSSAAPRVVLGMTLYNAAEYLPEAMDSLLAQTYADFGLVLLDDASSDGTERICREYEARDPRVRYHRHAARQAMVATWREVVEVAAREYPTAESFAWVSDHDRWHPEWLGRLLDELDAHPEAVMAYPMTRRIAPDGTPLDKTPRQFEATGLAGPRERWSRFCREGTGSGDMIYGLMRIDAMRRVGIFRTALRPDRLLVAEMSLQGAIRQVPHVLWFRRHFGETSVSRQRQTLVVPGAAPRWFGLPPVIQHSLILYREYARSDSPPLPIGRRAWLGMIAEYQFQYLVRHVRKSEASRALERAVDRVKWTRKNAASRYRHAADGTREARRAWFRRLRHARRHAVGDALVRSHRFSKEARSGALGVWAAARRFGRRSIYHVLVLTHRAGWRRRGELP